MWDVPKAITLSSKPMRRSNDGLGLAAADAGSQVPKPEKDYTGLSGGV